MELSSVEALADGALSFLALSWPDEGRTSHLQEAVAIPVLKRQEGVILCIPCGFLALSVLDAGAEADALATVGHSRQVKVPFGVADEQGTEQAVWTWRRRFCLWILGVGC